MGYVVDVNHFEVHYFLSSGLEFRILKFLKGLTGLLGYVGVSETDISPNKNC